MRSREELTRRAATGRLPRLLPQPGWLQDKYGLSWQIVPAVFFDMIKDPDPDKVARVTKAMLSMTKFDIAGLEKAYAGQ